MENEINENALPENEPNREVKKKRKKGSSNMRESLAWNPAFLSDEGVLDSDELSSLGGPLPHHNITLLTSNDTGAEKPMKSLPMTNEDVFVAEKYGNEMNSELSSAHNIDQGIKFQHRTRGQEIKFGYKVLASAQAAETTYLDPRHGGCPRPSGLNLQRKMTKTTKSGVFNDYLDYKPSDLAKKNGSIKPYKTTLSDASVKNKSNSICIESSLDSVRWTCGVPSAKVNNSQDIMAGPNEIRPSVVLCQKPSRLRMPSPSLGFFSQGKPKFCNSPVQDVAHTDKHSNFELVLSSPCFPNSNMKSSYHTFSSKLNGNMLLKLDGKLASEYSNVKPEASMPTKSPLLSKAPTSDTGNMTLTYDKRGNMQTSTVLSQAYGTHVVEASSFFGSDFKNEGEDMVCSNDHKEKGELQSEQVDNSDETNLKLLSDSTISPCGCKLRSELSLSPEVSDSGVEGDIQLGDNVDCISRPEVDSVVDSILNQNGSSVPIANAHGHCYPHENMKDPFSHTQCPSPSALNHSDCKEMQEKKNALLKQDACQIKLNPIPFSDEWLAAIESVGEEFLANKSGNVQNSPPEKAIPEPSPWSPVKRNVRGPFDCTKHLDAPSSNSSAD